MTIKDDKLSHFSIGFQHITQLDKGFRLVYNMMDIGYKMVTWPIWVATIWYNTMFGIVRFQIGWE